MLFLQQFGVAEVNDTRGLLAVNQHVARMNVAVKDYSLVQLAIRAKNGADDAVKIAAGFPICLSAKLCADSLRVRSGKPFRY